MDVYIPYRSEDPKTRLSSVLDLTERELLGRTMLGHVTETVREAGHSPVILARGKVDIDAPVVHSTEPLSAAVNETIETHESLSGSSRSGVGVVMADVPLVTSGALELLFKSTADVTVAPGKRGGTNAFVTRSQDFSVDYHGASYLDHRRIARRRDLSFETVDSFRLATDIDEPGDLVELYIHGTDRPKAFLEERFRLATDEETGPQLVRKESENTAETERTISNG